MKVVAKPSDSGKGRRLALLILGIGVILLSSKASLAVYDLPNDNNGCPDDCRQVPWLAGSDQWNGGELPEYPPVTCTGLAGDGSTEDGSKIQTCINNAAPNTAVYVPAGVYYVNTNLRLKNNVSLRGAKTSSPPYLPSADSSATTFKLGSSGAVSFTGGSTGSNVGISSGYTKGSTTLVMNSGHGFSTGDWILISEDSDTEIPVTASGASGTCTWCGESGSHFMTQFAQVTSVSGNTITISRPMYYTFKSSLSPVARKVTFGVKYAGLENIRLDGSYTNHGAFITTTRALFIWVKGVETYEAGSGAKDFHVFVQWSHGAEIRDSYFHHWRTSGSDRNYGIAFMFPNSDHKVENNILRNHRHSTSFEGGGSGIVVLYNYIDDDYTTDDGTYLGSARTNHGTHPYMNLFEGNIISHITADRYWGSSSHVVFFRNWLWGDETGDVPQFPNGGFVAIDVYRDNNYYSFVGNVLGVTGMHTNWQNANLRPSPPSDPWTSINSPIVYGYGSDTASSTSINHGNYDYRTQGVAYWEGGSDHALRNSMYYNSRPDWWCSDTPWPAMGPDASGVANDIPAKLRYEGTSCTLGPECSGSSDCPDIECNTKACVSGSCQYTPLTEGTSCSNGLYCDGAETCHSGACQSPGSPCEADAFSCTTTCDESTHSCNVPDDSICLPLPSGCTSGTCNVNQGCVYLPADCGPGDLAGYWDFEEGSGTTASDSSGNSNHGTLSGAAWTTNSAEGSYALDVNTDTGYVEVGTNNFNANAGTISLWAYADSFDSDDENYLFGHTTTPAYANRIQLYRDDATASLCLGLGTSHEVATGIFDLDTGTWYHIAITWDGTDYEVFVNGNSEASGAYSGLTAIAPIADIGNNGNPDSRTDQWNGYIDDVRVFNRVLTGQEISDLSGGEGQGPSCTSGADTSGNVAVEMTELMSYIAAYNAGSVTMSSLMAAIGEWVDGC